MHFPSEPESKSLLLPLFCCCLCGIRANSMSFHGGLIAALQQTTLSLGKYTLPTPARQASHKGSKHVRLPAVS